MNAYPEKLRERAMEALEKGYTKKAVIDMFGLNYETLKRWEKLRAETGSLEEKPSNRTAYKISREKLEKYYEENPHSTNKEAAIEFKCSASGIFHAKKSMGITRKKTPLNTSSVTKKNVMPSKRK